ncbi:MAG: universal stress protein [Acidobacteriota bacterium]
MKVLIGYDGSASSDAVFEDLKRAGLPPDAEAVVASVGDLVMSSRSVQDAVVQAVSSQSGAAGAKRAQTSTDTVIEETKAFAELGKKRIQEHFPGWKVSSEVFTGTPAWVLIDAAEKLNADLIVVGSQGRSAVGRLLLGSVSKRIATDARCSVRVARAVDQNGEWPSSKPPRLLVGVDGSPDAEQAIFSIGQRVWPDGTEVRLAAINDSAPPPSIIARLPQAAAMINSYMRTREVRIASMLDWATEELGHIGLRTSVYQEKGDPQQVLLDEAEKWRADSIFVGTRDLKSSFERFRLGSVSTAIMTNAHCSVEIVRPQEVTMK